jgi:3-oxoacyl-(acyl-carrier-protein) synthase
MRRRAVPPTVGLVQPDQDAQGWVSAEPVKLATELDQSITAISTNSGFGGVNTALLLHQGAQQ